MKSSLPSFALAALLASGLGLVALTGGCASTATQASTGEFIDDSSITVKVKAAFMKDPVVKMREVSVETFKSVVQLSGFVDTAEEKAQAARIASSIDGVTEVKNSIVVKG